MLQRQPPRHKMRAERLGKLDNKRWEGFVLTTLIGAAGTRASARAYRIDDDEIDLVLQWPDHARPWAIEVTTSPRKSFSPGNRRAWEHVGADRVIMIDSGPAGRLSNGRTERMRLIEALRAVAEGPDG